MINKKIISNFFSPTILFVFTRYCTYFLYFVNSLIIAAKFGPYYLGIWGFLQLIIQYINQINFGIHHSVNVLISIEKNKVKYVQKIVGNSIVVITIMCILLLCFFVAIYQFDFQIGQKYNFFKYIWFILGIGCLGYFNSLFSNIYRVFGNLRYIALNQSIFPLCTFFCILFFEGETLLYSLLYCNVLSWLICFSIFVINQPISFRPQWSKKISLEIINKGFFLFIYNTCFYFILLSTRSFVSFFYEIREFGMFTFTFTLSQSIMLFFEALAFLIFPKILNKFSTSSSDQVLITLNKMRNVYITLVHLIVHIAIVIYPIVILFFPAYNTTTMLFSLFALTISTYSNSFGLAEYLMAKNKEIKLSFISLAILLVNIIICLYLSYYQGVSFIYLICSTLIAYFLYNLLVGWACFNLLKKDFHFFEFFKYVYPIKILFPFITSLFMILFYEKWYLNLIVLILFLFMNFSTFGLIYKEFMRFAKNPNIINI